MTTREEYVEQLKACCREIIDRADEFMPEPEFRTQVKFVINFSVYAMPNIGISQIFVPISTVGVINKYMNKNKQDDEHRIFKREECGGFGGPNCETCDMPCPYR